MIYEIATWLFLSATYIVLSLLLAGVLREEHDVSPFLALPFGFAWPLTGAAILAYVIFGAIGYIPILLLLRRSTAILTVESDGRRFVSRKTGLGLKLKGRDLFFGYQEYQKAPVEPQTALEAAESEEAR